MAPGVVPRSAGSTDCRCICRRHAFPLCGRRSSRHRPRCPPPAAGEHSPVDNVAARDGLGATSQLCGRRASGPSTFYTVSEIHSTNRVVRCIYGQYCVLELLSVRLGGAYPHNAEWWHTWYEEAEYERSQLLLSYSEQYSPQSAPSAHRLQGFQSLPGSTCCKFWMARCSIAPSLVHCDAQCFKALTQLVAVLVRRLECVDAFLALGPQQFGAIAKVDLDRFGVVQSLAGDLARLVDC